MRVNWLQFFRKTHLYVGVFTAPAILFFALSGTLQTFSLPESVKGSSYKPPRWILLFAQIHKKQIAQVPVPKVPPQRPAAVAQMRVDLTEQAAAQPQQPAAQAQPPVPRGQHNPLPLRVFFLIVGLSLFTSTVSGLYLAWKYRRDRIVLAVLLLAGILAPIALMQF
jgi:uncharacterized iron-regulated membrane protein